MSRHVIMMTYGEHRFPLAMAEAAGLARSYGSWELHSPMLAAIWRWVEVVIAEERADARMAERAYQTGEPIPPLAGEQLPDSSVRVEMPETEVVRWERDPEPYDTHGSLGSISQALEYADAVGLGDEDPGSAPARLSNKERARAREGGPTDATSCADPWDGPRFGARLREFADKVTPRSLLSCLLEIADEIDRDVEINNGRLEEAAVRRIVELTAYKDSIIAMAVARLGGTVEGTPTHSGNFLQRIDELVAIERVAKEDPLR